MNFHNVFKYHSIRGIVTRSVNGSGHTRACHSRSQAHRTTSERRTQDTATCREGLRTASRHRLSRDRTHGRTRRRPICLTPRMRCCVGWMGWRRRATRGRICLRASRTGSSADNTPHLCRNCVRRRKGHPGLWGQDTRARRGNSKSRCPCTGSRKRGQPPRTVL